MDQIQTILTRNPNYYMDVTVKINPWVLNTKDIELK